MVKKPFIGQKDRQVTISLKVSDRDAVGGYSNTLQPIATTWAYMEEVSGKEDSEGKVVHLIDRKYTIRYRPDVVNKSTNLVLEDKGQKFEVIHIIEIGRKDHLEIRVKRYE